MLKKENSSKPYKKNQYFTQKLSKIQPIVFAKINKQKIPKIHFHRPKLKSKVIKIIGQGSLRKHPFRNRVVKNSMKKSNK